MRREAEMSRDQKPGKVKLVASSATNRGRRISDALPSDAASAVRPGVGAPGATAGHKGAALLPALLFLAACAAGGAGTVFFGLVGGVVE